MRVVHVNVVRPRGRPAPEDLLAVWPTLADVAGAVRRAGAEVTVVQSFHRAAELNADGVTYRFVAEPALSGRATGLAPGRLAEAARDCAPDVIHVNGLDFDRHTRALTTLGVPVLAQDHCSTPGLLVGRRRRALHRVAGVAFTAIGQARPFVDEGSLAAGVPVFSVPESSTRFTPGDQAAARAESGVDGDPAVLWVGRLNAKKDPLTILDAIEQAAADLPGLRLWCCFHEQPLLSQVEARIAASPTLAARVRLLGRRSHAEIETLCRAADLFILGSRSEGSGYALIEALACGTTPIVSDIPPFRRLTGEVGALAPVGDAAAFARALVALAAQPRAELRARAIAHFNRELSFEIVGARLCAAYAALTEARR